MRRPLPALALTLLAGIVSAEPSDLLKPMAFLAGHCWKGTFPDGKKSDEHCFAWLYGGQVLRDTHTVRTADAAVFTGETTYYVDTAGKRIEFLYIESTGGFSRGSVDSAPGALSFPDGRYTSDGETLAYRASWTRRGDQAYEALSQAQTPKGWATMFRLVMRRTD
jgi:hypothetical protein